MNNIKDLCQECKRGVPNENLNRNVCGVRPFPLRIVVWDSTLQYKGTTNCPKFKQKTHRCPKCNGKMVLLQIMGLGENSWQPRRCKKCGHEHNKYGDGN